LEALGIGGIVDFQPLINNALESKMVVGNGFNKDNWIENLGNFPIRSLQSIPEALQQSGFYNNAFLKQYKVQLGTGEKALRKYIQDIMSESRKHCAIMELHRVRFNPEDYPVLIARRGNDATGLKEGTVWPRDNKTDKSFHKRQVNFRLNKFLDHLNVCCSKFMEFQPGDEMEQLFFKWFGKILFNPGQDKLPLLGSFNWEKGRQVDSFSAQDFNEFQALVLNIIADPNSQRRNFQAALSVLGFWLKNEQSGLYNQLFKNDDDYWDQLTELLQSEFEFIVPIRRKRS